MVILRMVSRTIYVFTLIALILIWVPAVTHVNRLPFAIGIGSLGVLAAAGFGWMVLRLPSAARWVVRRTLCTRRVAAALALALGGVAAAFGIVAFTPEARPRGDAADRGGHHRGRAAGRLRCPAGRGPQAVTR